MRRLLATFALFWCVAAELHAQELDPLRAVHLSGNWGHTADAVNFWEMDRTQPLVPLRYVEYLRSVHVNWVGFSVALHVEHSMDSTLERMYSDVRVQTFSDDAVRQIIREFRAHGFNVYMTLAIESFEQEDELDAVERPAPRFQLGDPGYPDTGVPDDHLFCTCARQIDPDFWPWRPSHPEHERFVAEFWESYAEQAIHFARIAQEEGARMYSLGTETERLFRTRSGGDYWVNDFGPQLRSMVDRVRAVYSGLLTYDMQYKAYWRDWFAPGSWHLWEDLDLDVIGVSAWFPLVDEPPTTVMGVDSLRREYERIFRNHLIPMAERNPGRPLVFLEYAAVDTVEAPAGPNIWPDNSSFVFADTNGNGLDDGQEVQNNMYRALFEVMAAYPGLVHGAFFWDTWIAVNEGHWASPLIHRAYSFRGKLSEHTVREWHDTFRTTAWRLPMSLYVSGAGAVAAALPFAGPVQVSSSGAACHGHRGRVAGPTHPPVRGLDDNHGHGGGHHAPLHRAGAAGGAPGRRYPTRHCNQGDPFPGASDRGSRAAGGGEPAARAVDRSGADGGRHASQAGASDGVAQRPGRGVRRSRAALARLHGRYHHHRRDRDQGGSRRTASSCRPGLDELSPRPIAQSALTERWAVAGSGTWWLLIRELFAAGRRAVGGSRQRVWSVFPPRWRVYGPRVADLGNGAVEAAPGCRLAEGTRDGRVRALVGRALRRPSRLRSTVLGTPRTHGFAVADHRLGLGVPRRCPGR